MNQEKLPRQVRREKMKIDDLEVYVVILDDGTRVFPEEDFNKILNWMGLTKDEFEKIQSNRDFSLK